MKIYFNTGTQSSKPFYYNYSRRGVYFGVTSLFVGCLFVGEKKKKKCKKPFINNSQASSISFALSLFFFFFPFSETKGHTHTHHANRHAHNFSCVEFFFFWSCSSWIKKQPRESQRISKSSSDEEKIEKMKDSAQQREPKRAKLTHHVQYITLYSVYFILLLLFFF